MTGPATADLILRGGHVLTMSADSLHRPLPTALAVRNGQVVAVGPEEAVQGWLGRDTSVVELAGRYVLPGFTDTHTHLATDSRSASADRVECRDFYDPSIRSVQDVLSRMATAAEVVPHGQLIVGTGSPMMDLRLAERRRPTSDELTAAVPHHPAYITFGAHVMVVNRMAIELAGVDRFASDPPGGVFERREDGSISGTVRERAQIPFRRLEGSGDFESFKSSIERALLLAASRGVTTIHDIIKSRDELRAYQELNREGRLPVRVQLVIRVIESEFAKWSLLDLGIQHGLGDDKLRIGGIKMSIDGGFTGRQASFTPIDHEPHGNHPLIRIEQEELDDTVRRYHDAGMRLCVHASGNAAHLMILDSFNRTFGGADVSERRHRIEHLGNWLFSEDNIALTRDMGIIPVPNPSTMYHLAGEAIETLGEERTIGAFPIRRILDEGMPFAPGADSPGYWPVDPLRDAGACISRESVGGVSLAPEQAIGNAEALTAITRTGAYLGFVEDRLGTLEEGKLADLVVVPGNPLTATAAEFGRIPVDLTVNAGTVVAGRDLTTSPHSTGASR